MRLTLDSYNLEPVGTCPRFCSYLLLPFPSAETAVVLVRSRLTLTFQGNMFINDSTCFYYYTLLYWDSIIFLLRHMLYIFTFIRC